MLALKLITAPAKEPVDLATMKQHLRLDITDDDALLTNILLSARRQVEKFTARRLITQTWDYYLDRYPIEDTMVMPLAPVITINTIETTDNQLNVTTFDPSNYFVDNISDQTRIVLRLGKIWPVVAYGLKKVNAIRINFDVGYGTDPAVVPQELLEAIKMLAAHFYQHREETEDKAPARIPLGVRYLLAPYRLFENTL